MRKIAPLGQRVQNVTYFEVEIGITDQDASLLRPRMSGDADIVTEVIEDALIVPETALRYRGAETYVQIAHGRGRGADRRDGADRHRRRHPRAVAGRRRGGPAGPAAMSDALLALDGGAQDLRDGARAGPRAARHRPRDRTRRAGRDHGAVGRRQDHAARDPRLPLDAEQRSLPARRQRGRGARRRRPRPGCAATRSASCSRASTCCRA